MRLSFYISPKEHDKFAASMEVVLRNVHRGTKGATEQACKEILEESLKQVPRDTGTLASTAFFEVSRRTDTKGYLYEGVVGYAGTAGAGAGANHDKFNPRSKATVSSYALTVHEDLDAAHPSGGKAKFLEDPVRQFASERFKRVAETHWRYSIEGGEAVQVSK